MYFQLSFHIHYNITRNYPENNWFMQESKSSGYHPDISRPIDSLKAEFKQSMLEWGDYMAPATSVLECGRRICQKLSAPSYCRSIFYQVEIYLFNLCRDITKNYNIASK